MEQRLMGPIHCDHWKPMNDPWGKGEIGRTATMPAEPCPWCTIDLYREALKIIADGTVCPELFPDVHDVWELQAKTAMTAALAVLEKGVSDG